MKMEWREPPEIPTPGRRSRFDPVIEELRGNVGEWGVVRKYGNQARAHSAVSNCRKRFPDCEFLSAKEGDGWTVFGRMLLKGPEKEE